MATTTLFAEIIVIGIQGTIWILLLLATYVGITELEQDAVLLSKWSALVAFLAFAAFYTLGIILDRVFHAISDLIKLPSWLLKIDWVKEKVYEYSKDSIVEIYYLAGILTPFYQYIISRWRIARATFFNTCISVICIMLYWIRHTDIADDHKRYLIFLIIIGIPMIIMSLISFTINDAAKNTRGNQILLFFAKNGKVTGSGKGAGSAFEL